MQIIIHSEKVEVLAIINRLISKYGKEAKLQDVMRAEYNKEVVILN